MPIRVWLINYRASVLYVDLSAKTFASIAKGLSGEKASARRDKKRTSRSQFDGQNRSAGNTFVDVNKQFVNN